MAQCMVVGKGMLDVSTVEAMLVAGIMDLSGGREIWCRRLQGTVSAITEIVHGGGMHRSWVDVDLLRHEEWGGARKRR